MARRRLNPIVWTLLGAAIGFAIGFKWSNPAALSFDAWTLLYGTLAGLFVTTLVAAWPKPRHIPTAPCPRCGQPMKWDVVVCPNCGEIR